MPELQPNMEDIDTSIQACVPFYGPQDLTYRYNQITRSKDAQAWLTIHGDHDSVVPVRDSQVFVKKLREVSNNPVVYAELPGADHAFDSINSLRTRHTVNGVHRYLEWTRIIHQQNTH